MIFYRGYGIWAIPLYFVIAVVVAVGMIFLFNAISVSNAAGIGTFVGNVAAAAGLFFWGRYLNDKPELFKTKEGEQYEVKNYHTFFFIPVQYFGIAFGLLGAVVTIQKALS